MNSVKCDSEITNKASSNSFDDKLETKKRFRRKRKLNNEKAAESPIKRIFSLPPERKRVSNLKKGNQENIKSELEDLLILVNDEGRKNFVQDELSVLLALAFEKASEPLTAVPSDPLSTYNKLKGKTGNIESKKTLGLTGATQKTIVENGELRELLSSIDSGKYKDTTPEELSQLFNLTEKQTADKLNDKSGLKGCRKSLGSIKSDRGNVDQDRGLKNSNSLIRGEGERNNVLEELFDLSALTSSFGKSNIPLETNESISNKGEEKGARTRTSRRVCLKTGVHEYTNRALEGSLSLSRDENNIPKELFDLPTLARKSEESNVPLAANQDICLPVDNKMNQNNRITERGSSLSTLGCDQDRINRELEDFLSLVSHAGDKNSIPKGVPPLLSVNKKFEELSVPSVANETVGLSIDKNVGKNIGIAEDKRPLRSRRNDQNNMKRKTEDLLLLAHIVKDECTISEDLCQHLSPTGKFEKSDVSLAYNKTIFLPIGAKIHERRRFKEAKKSRCALRGNKEIVNRKCEDLLPLIIGESDGKYVPEEVSEHLTLISTSGKSNARLPATKISQLPTGSKTNEKDEFTEKNKPLSARRGDQININREFADLLSLVNAAGAKNTVSDEISELLTLAFEKSSDPLKATQTDDELKEKKELTESKGSSRSERSIQKNIVHNNSLALVSGGGNDEFKDFMCLTSGEGDGKIPVEFFELLTHVNASEKSRAPLADTIISELATGSRTNERNAITKKNKPLSAKRDDQVNTNRELGDFLSLVNAGEVKNSVPDEISEIITLAFKKSSDPLTANQTDPFSAGDELKKNAGLTESKGSLSSERSIQKDIVHRNSLALVSGGGNEEFRDLMPLISGGGDGNKIPEEFSELLTLISASEAPLAAAQISELHGKANEKNIFTVKKKPLGDGQGNVNRELKEVLSLRKAEGGISNLPEEISELLTLAFEKSSDPLKATQTDDELKEKKELTESKGSLRSERTIQKNIVHNNSLALISGGGNDEFKDCMRLISGEGDGKIPVEFFELLTHVSASEKSRPPLADTIISELATGSKTNERSAFIKNNKPLSAKRDDQVNINRELEDFLSLVNAGEVKNNVPDEISELITLAFKKSSDPLTANQTDPFSAGDELKKKAGLTESKGSLSSERSIQKDIVHRNSLALVSGGGNEEFRDLMPLIRGGGDGNKIPEEFSELLTLISASEAPLAAAQISELHGKANEKNIFTVKKKSLRDGQGNVNRKLKDVLSLRKAEGGISNLPEEISELLTLAFEKSSNPLKPTQTDPLSATQFRDLMPLISEGVDGNKIPEEFSELLSLISASEAPLATAQISELYGKANEKNIFTVKKKPLRDGQGNVNRELKDVLSLRKAEEGISNLPEEISELLTLAFEKSSNPLKPTQTDPLSATQFRDLMPLISGGVDGNKIPEEFSELFSLISASEAPLATAQISELYGKANEKNIFTVKKKPLRDGQGNVNRELKDVLSLRKAEEGISNLPEEISELLTLAFEKSRNPLKPTQTDPLSATQTVHLRTGVKRNEKNSFTKSINIFMQTKDNQEKIKSQSEKKLEDSMSYIRIGADKNPIHEELSELLNFTSTFEKSNQYLMTESGHKGKKINELIDHEGTSNLTRNLQEKVARSSLFSLIHASNKTDNRVIRTTNIEEGKEKFHRHENVDYLSLFLADDDKEERIQLDIAKSPYRGKKLSKNEEIRDNGNKNLALHQKTKYMSAKVEDQSKLEATKMNMLDSELGLHCTKEKCQVKTYTEKPQNSEHKLGNMKVVNLEHLLEGDSAIFEQLVANLSFSEKIGKANQKIYSHSKVNKIDAMSGESFAHFHDRHKTEIALDSTAKPLAKTVYEKTSAKGYSTEEKQKALDDALVEREKNVFLQELLTSRNINPHLQTPADIEEILELEKQNFNLDYCEPSNEDMGSFSQLTDILTQPNWQSPQETCGLEKQDNKKADRLNELPCFRKPEHDLQTQKALNSKNMLQARDQGPKSKTNMSSSDSKIKNILTQSNLANQPQAKDGVKVKTESHKLPSWYSSQLLSNSLSTQCNFSSEIENILSQASFQSQVSGECILGSNNAHYASTTAYLDMIRKENCFFANDGELEKFIISHLQALNYQGFKLTQRSQGDKENISQLTNRSFQSRENLQDSQLFADFTQTSVLSLDYCLEELDGWNFGKSTQENIEKSHTVAHDSSKATQGRTIKPKEIVFTRSRDGDDTLSTGSAENFSNAEKRLRQGLNRISKDKSLLFQEKFGIAVLYEETRDNIKRKIANVFIKLHKDIMHKRPPILKIRDRNDLSNYLFANNGLVLKPVGAAKCTEINGAKSISRSKFTLIVFLLGKILNLLANDSTCTRREIYYQIIKFVKNKALLDNAIDSVSCLLDEPPWDLGILASRKGLVYGDLNIIISASEVIHCNVPGGSLIPQDIREITKLESQAYFILVVEKDAIFQKLLDEDLPNSLTRPFIMITGKGFPDINTRLFVKKLWKLMSIPVFILVDADPFGIEIMLTYRFGSLNMSHLNEHLALSNSRWIGVHPSEIIDLNISRQSLSPKDQHKIEEMLKRPYVNSFPKLREELSVLLENDFKAEIEGLIKCDTFLRNFYLPNKFYTQDYF